MKHLALMVAALAAPGLSALAAAPQSGAPVVALYGWRGDLTGTWLEELNSNGDTVRSVGVWGTYPYPILKSFTCMGDRLLTIDRASNPTASNRLARVHPVTAAIDHIGPIGLFNQTASGKIEFHPGSGRIYYTEYFSLWRLDPQTGARTFVTYYSNFAAPGDAIVALAVDPQGRLLAFGGEAAPSLNTIYEVDVQTGYLTTHALYTVPNARGYPKDAAIAPDGTVWISFWDSDANPVEGGLYKLDLQPGYVAQLMRALPVPHEGIAFLPATVQASYCTAKPNSLGCPPAISGEGFPSPSAPYGYTVRAAQVRSNSMGTLVWSASGRANVPFGGGTMCLAFPWRRTPAQISGGSATPDCSGTWELDFNVWMAGHVALPAGVTVQCQWTGRDPGFAWPNNWTLSDALEFILRP